MRFVLKRGPEQLHVEVAGQVLAVTVIRNARAKRLILRIDAASGQPRVTLPARTSLAQAERFLRNHAGWLEARLQRLPEAVGFSDGAVLPLRGEPCRIEHRGGRGLVRLEMRAGAAILSVPGEAAHLGRRITDWLKREARRDLAAAVARHAAAIGRTPKSIRVGDARSRWGSCTSAGTLTFSWRLVLAPTAVLDYLAAHEVAHLAEMNHSAGFWALVKRLDPDLDAARRWLKQHGPTLHAVGRRA